MSTLQSAKDIILNRHSLYVKQMSGEKIPNETIDELLQLAHRAPTHKITEPWRFLIFNGTALHKLVDFWEKLFLEKNGENANPAKLEKFALNREKVSHIIAVVCDLSHQLPEVEEICATACAVENFWIGLCASGYGGYWSTGGDTFNPAMHHWLGLKENQKLLGFFYCGVPLENLQRVPSRRSELHTKISWYTS